MPISVEWDNEDKTAIRITYLDRWTWEENQQARQQTLDMIATVNHIVHTIHDMRQSHGLPTDIITQARKRIQKKHPQVGLIIVIGNKSFVHVLYDVFATIYDKLVHKRKFYLVHSLEQAYQLIDEFTTTQKNL